MNIPESDIDAVVAVGNEYEEFSLLSEEERREIARKFLVSVNIEFAKAAAKFRDNPERLVVPDVG